MWRLELRSCLEEQGGSAKLVARFCVRFREGTRHPRHPGALCGRYANICRWGPRRKGRNRRSSPVERDGNVMASGFVVRGRKTVDRAGIPSIPSGGIINAGLYARGDHANQMVPIFLALRAGRRRLPFTDPFKRGIGASYVVPLYARRNDTLISKDAWSIWNLCVLLAQRPELQLRLGEPIRMENLLRDLKQHRLPVVHAHLAVRTESVEIRAAMRGANIVHPLGGRPVPGEVLVDRAEAVSKIVARMATIPYSRGAKVVSKHVEEVLDVAYFNIEPWPFAALVGDADRLEPGSPISPQP